MGDAVVGSGETVSVETPIAADGTFAVVIAGLQTFPVQVKGGLFVFPKDPSIEGQVNIPSLRDLYCFGRGLMLGLFGVVQGWEYRR